MSNTLERRLARLECGTADTPGMFVHWAIDEQAQTLECNGQRFTRRDGEGHEDFMERVMESLSPAPGKVLWLDEVDALAIYQRGLDKAYNDEVQAWDFWSPAAQAANGMGGK